jgi:hypothetical protein
MPNLRQSQICAKAKSAPKPNLRQSGVTAMKSKRREAPEVRAIASAN